MCQSIACNFTDHLPLRSNSRYDEDVHICLVCLAEYILKGKSREISNPIEHEYTSILIILSLCNIDKDFLF